MLFIRSTPLQQSVNDIVKEMKSLADAEEEIKTSIAFMEKKIGGFGKSLEDLGEATTNLTVDNQKTFIQWSDRSAGLEQKLNGVATAVKQLKGDIVTLDSNVVDQKTEIKKMMADSFLTNYALATSVLKLAMI